MDALLPFEPVFSCLRTLRQPDQQVYLVGGTLRDALLGRAIHDLDFSASGDVRALARKAAKRLDGSFFMLDDVRQTARIVIKPVGESELTLDFTALRSGDLNSDLRGRDFTINAIALNLDDPQVLIDPLSGAADLREKTLRICSDASMQDDPLRILRGVRLASELKLRIEPGTRQAMKDALPGLERVSAERIRDELFRILEGPSAATGLRVMDALGVLEAVLPEATALRGVTQSDPHVYDVLNHTLAVVERLDQLFGALVGTYTKEANDLTIGKAVLWLGCYRQKLNDHFRQVITPGRSLRGLLMLAALYHDSGKPQKKTIDPPGKMHFYEHDRLSADLVVERAQALVLSSAEIERLRLITRYHMRVHFLAKETHPPNRRSIFRFFRATGSTGVEVCLLSLADVLATYGVTLTQEKWEAELDVCRDLLDNWFERPSEAVAPKRLVNGQDLIDRFQLQPGPQIGRLLDAIREGQAAGELNAEEDIYRFANDWLSHSRSDQEA